MLIGISAQKNKPNKIFTPLDPETNSGKFIQQIENQLPQISFYKTNLIKCAPLNSDNKIRYPTTEEYQTCFSHLENEIKKTNPKTIILLGEKVANFITNKLQIKKEKYKPIPYNNKIIIYIDHPSYIMIYKRKQLKKYQNEIIKLLSNNLTLHK